MFDKFKTGVAESAAQIRALDESLYEIVAAEIDRGERRPGLWAKAIADCRGSEAKATSLYLKYRVQSLKDELTLKRSADEARRETEAQRETRNEAVAEARRKEHLMLVENLEKRGFVYITKRAKGEAEFMVKDPSLVQMSFDSYSVFKSYAERAIRDADEEAERQLYLESSPDTSNPIVVMIFSAIVLIIIIYLVKR